MRNFTASVLCTILKRPMTVRGVAVLLVIRNSLLTIVTLAIVLCLVTRWTDFSLLACSVRPKRASSSCEDNQSRVRFVSMCSSNFDGRQLGNQLFNWAAMLYVAHLTGRLYTCVGSRALSFSDRYCQSTCRSNVILSFCLSAVSLKRIFSGNSCFNVPLYGVK